MDIRDRVYAALKDAMKSKEADRLSTLRLINAAIKDRDIALRGSADEEGGVTDDDVMGIMGRMVKQRQESARAYEEGGRLELAEKELAEIKVIEEFLPKQLSEEEVQTALEAALISPRNAEGTSGHASAVQYTISRTNNVLATSTIEATVAIRPLSYPDYYPTMTQFPSEIS